MQHYLIIGGSSGIGQQLSNATCRIRQASNSNLNKTEPTFENPLIRIHYLNVLEETLSLDFFYPMNWPD